MSEHSEWMQHPVTIEKLKKIAERRLEIALELAEGKTLNLQSAENTLALTAQTAGVVRGLEEAVDIMKDFD